MKIINIGNDSYEVPAYHLYKDEAGQTIFRIEDGEFADVEFMIKNMSMDEADEGLMHYDLFSDAPVNDIKPVVDNIIFDILNEQINREASNTK